MFFNPETHPRSVGIFCRMPWMPQRLQRISAIYVYAGRRSYRREILLKKHQIYLLYLVDFLIPRIPHLSSQSDLRYYENPQTWFLWQRPILNDNLQI
jgi:hypothetical protein